MILKNLKTNVINKHKLNADQLTILTLIFYKNVDELESYKISLLNLPLLIQNLYRRGYIDFYGSNRDYSQFEDLYVTAKGEKALEDVNKLVENVENLQKLVTNIEQSFEEFWANYPSTDKWGSFEATRALRQNKEGTRIKWRKCLEKYKPEDIIKALKYQIEMFKNTSKLGQNKMTYMQNSAAYLHQEIFTSYLEAMKETEIENDSMEVKL